MNQCKETLQDICSKEQITSEELFYIINSMEPRPLNTKERKLPDFMKNIENNKNISEQGKIDFFQK